MAKSPTCSKSNCQSVLSRRKHHQCTGFEYFDTLLFSLLLEGRIFGARVKNQAFRIQVQDIIVKFPLPGRVDIKRYGIDILQLGFAFCDGDLSNTAISGAKCHNLVPVLFKLLHCLE